MYLCGSACVCENVSVCECLVVPITATQPPTSPERLSLSAVHMGRRRYSVWGTNVSRGATTRRFE